jgi:hypothetical protein
MNVPRPRHLLVLVVSAPLVGLLGSADPAPAAFDSWAGSVVSRVCLLPSDSIT